MLERKSGQSLGPVSPVEIRSLSALAVLPGRVRLAALAAADERTLDMGLTSYYDSDIDAANEHPVEQVATGARPL